MGSREYPVASDPLDRPTVNTQETTVSGDPDGAVPIHGRGQRGLRRRLRRREWRREGGGREPVDPSARGADPHVALVVDEEGLDVVGGEPAFRRHVLDLRANETANPFRSETDPNGARVVLEHGPDGTQSAPVGADQPLEGAPVELGHAVARSNANLTEAPDVQPLHRARVFELRGAQRDQLPSIDMEQVPRGHEPDAPVLPLRDLEHLARSQRDPGSRLEAGDPPTLQEGTALRCADPHPALAVLEK